MAHHAVGADEITERVAQPPVTVHALHDPALIRGLLLPHRGYAAYALGQLAPRLLPFVRCWYAQRDGGEGLVMHSSGGLGDASFLLGDVRAVDAILRLHRGPRRTFTTCAPEHLPVLERYFRVTHAQTMARMMVDRTTFERPAMTDGHVHVRRLHAEDARLVNRLYNIEGAPTFYSATHIETGYYHGAFYDARLVAVAGTHVVSPEERVAVVGNVFTHPRYRGRGYATLATGMTTAAILEECDSVALTVDPRNVPAVRAYWRLGYSETCRLVEAPVTRRDLTGIGPLLRRTAASWRGRTSGVEIVK